MVRVKLPHHLRELANVGEEVLVSPASVTIEGILDAVEAALGPVEILVNNAGITRDTMFHRMKPEQWSQVINTNLNSLFNMTRPVWEGMRARKIAFPDLDREDMTNLLAFLYTTRYVDEPGDEDHDGDRKTGREGESRSQAETPAPRTGARHAGARPMKRQQATSTAMAAAHPARIRAARG